MFSGFWKLGRILIKRLLLNHFVAVLCQYRVMGVMATKLRVSNQENHWALALKVWKLQWLKQPKSLLTLSLNRTSKMIQIWSLIRTGRRWRHWYWVNSKKTTTLSRVYFISLFLFVNKCSLVDSLTKIFK